MNTFHLIKRNYCDSVILHHPVIPDIFAVICLLTWIIMPYIIAINNFKYQLIMFVLGSIKFIIEQVFYLCSNIFQNISKTRNCFLFTFIIGIKSMEQPNQALREQLAYEGDEVPEEIYLKLKSASQNYHNKSRCRNKIETIFIGTQNIIYDFRIFCLYLILFNFIISPIIYCNMIIQNFNYSK